MNQQSMRKTNTFKKLVATVAAASAVGATLTACGNQNTLVEAAD
ncbi:hypothetical protein [uncultured Corynebacterium sp.]|nr:hypothetical protein [uncultured Corynebacterium sp.]